MSANSTPSPVIHDAPLDTVDAGKYLGLSKFTLEKFRVAGTGPRFAKLGGAVRYRRCDLDAWIASKLVNSTSEAA